MPRGTDYIPTDHGALCAQCPLRIDRDGEPVPPQFYETAVALCVGEAPGKSEVKFGRPFAGPSGDELFAATREEGWYRPQMSYTNVLLCKPPPAPKGKGGSGKGDLEVYLQRLKQRGVTVNPVDCCWPRLVRELAAYDKALLLGGTAADTVTRLNKGVLALKGKALVLPALDVEGGFHRPALHAVCTVHPALVLRVKQWQPVFRANVQKAIRWFEGRRRSLPRTTILHPTVDQLARFLDDPDALFWSLDVETGGERPGDALEALRAELQCIGMVKVKDSPLRGRSLHACVWPKRSVQGGAEIFYSPQDTYRCEELIKAAFTDGRLWVGHNSGYYDRMVLSYDPGAFPDWATGHRDTLMMHKAAFPLLYHDLATVTVQLTDDEKSEGSSVVDADNWRYCANDCFITAQVAMAMAPIVQARKQDAVLPLRPDMTLMDLDHWKQDLCVKLHTNGLLVDQERRGEHELQWQAKAARFEGVVQCEAKALGYAGRLNPNGHAAIGKLLYGSLGLHPLGYTETGAPSIRDAYIREHILDKMTPEGVRKLLYGIRRYRRARNKWLGTYLLPLAENPLSADGKPLESLVWADGRVRFNWNAHGTMVGRLSADRIQQMPSIFRDIFVPRPGWSFVGGDVDQFHTRIFGTLWGIARLQETFERKGDPYVDVGVVCYGREFTNAEGFDPRKCTGRAKKIRKIAKEIFLSMAYGRMPPGMLETLRKAEDAEGGLVMGHLTVTDVATLREKILTAYPEMEKGWEREVDMAELNGKLDGSDVPWLSDPIVGRRRDFPNSIEDERAEIVNFRTLASEAGIVDMIVLDLLDRVAAVGLEEVILPVVHFHDDFIWEVRDDHVEWMKQQVNEASNRDFMGIPVTATGVSGKNLAEA